MSSGSKNPWDEFKPVASSRPKSRNTPGMLLLAIIFGGLVGFGIGATATGFIIMSESDDRRFVQRRTTTTFAQEHFKWFVLAGGLLGAGSVMGSVWKYWPKDLD